MSAYEWTSQATLYEAGEPAPAGRGVPYGGSAGSVSVGRLVDLVRQVQRKSTLEQHRCALELPNGERIVGARIADLADEADFPRS